MRGTRGMCVHRGTMGVRMYTMCGEIGMYCMYVRVNVHIFMCVHVLAAKQGRWACVNTLSVCECHVSKREQQPLHGHLPFHFACA